MAKKGFHFDWLGKLNKVKQYFPNLNFEYLQDRGSKIESFLHEAWVLYNLIEIFEPQKIWGLSYVTENSIEWKEGHFFPRRFYRWGWSGKQGPEKVIESVIPGIKIVRNNGDTVYIGYQNSFFGLRPDFSIYVRFKEIKLKNHKDRIDVLFDDSIMAVIKKSIEKDFINWSIEKYNFSPDIIVEAKESKQAISSGVRSNIKKYRQMFPNTKIVVVCPEQIDKTELQNCLFILDTYDKNLLERKKCDKSKFQQRLRKVIFSE